MLALARFGSDPLRFLDGVREDARDRSLLLPFSAGPYECHARGLATTEAG